MVTGLQYSIMKYSNVKLDFNSRPVEAYVQQQMLYTDRAETTLKQPCYTPVGK